MKVTLTFLVTAAVVAMLFDTSDGWWFRCRRRRLCRKVKDALKNTAKKHCPNVCKVICKGLGGSSFICTPICNFVCGRRKRSILAPGEWEIPFPTDFDDYDKNDDMKITPEEFAQAIHSNVKLSSKVFHMADKNGDGIIGEKEFLDSPFLPKPDLPEDIDDTEVDFDDNGILANETTIPEEYEDLDDGSAEEEEGVDPMDMIKLMAETEEKEEEIHQ